ncbi:hypothetical protein S83_038920, partial [Arachis hypogaea]
RSSSYSKEAKAKMFVDQVLDSKCWSQCANIVKLIEPLVRILRIINSEDRTAMDFLYQYIYKVKEEMVVDPYLRILDTQFEKNKQMTSGLLDVIEKYVYGYPNLNSKLTSEMKIFKNVEQDFERYFAIHERSIIMP